jgi:hypothetical protein
MRKYLLLLSAVALALPALVRPAMACPAGYKSVWIQGHKICRIQTPDLPLKAKTAPELKKSGALKAN